MNTKKLRISMLNHEKTVDDVCAAAGFSRTAYFRKMNGESEFTQAEISAIAQLLDMGVKEIGEIFFEDLVS